MMPSLFAAGPNSAMTENERTTFDDAVDGFLRPTLSML